MIITRTPFRISLFGGGTDYPVWYRENGGAVIGTTINKYCYISCRYLPPFFNFRYRIRYTFKEEVNDVSEIKHPSVRECLNYLGIQHGVEMVHTSDLPAQSGLGSSSSFTVGFLNSLFALTGKIPTKRQIARDAIHIEQDIIRENVGSQDQTFAAFGGLNKIEFGGEKNFYVRPITISQEKVNLLQDHLMLYFTGFSRNASEIAAEQIKNSSSKKAQLTRMQELVGEAMEVLNGRPEDITKIGKLLHETWQMKRELTKLITTSTIDAIYNEAIRAGALGGKLLGAGGGGFMLFFAAPEAQPAVKEKLKDLLYVPFRFETMGTQVIMYSTQDFF
ncbi:MAG: kinase [Candidatus Omnitrophota bacterium]